jgi:DNA primase
MIDNASQTELRMSRSEAGQDYALKKAIKAVKGAVSIEEYLSDRGVQVRGNRARCIVHGGDNPGSFAVYPDSEAGHWHCFRCLEGGDVIDLAQAVEGGEVWEAMFTLAQRYGVELPERGDGWRRHQNTKADMREEMRMGLVKVYQRRLYRMFQDASAHPEDDATLWDAMYQSAYLAATRRVFG